MHGPKVTVIGAGSYFFGREVIRKMATSPVMAGGTLALVDIQGPVLETMMRLARRVFAHTGCGVTLVGSTDRRPVMAGSDFVVLTFSRRNAFYRGLDTQIAARHGIRMCSSDTIGPGGIFRALREVPEALAMARDAHELAPSAWVINFVNPTAVLGMALRRFAPEVRSFALCDGHHEPYNTLRWCQTVGILPPEATTVPPDVYSRLDLALGGVNHYGAYPTATGHTKEYVPFFQGYGVEPIDPEPIALFDAEHRVREMAAAWQATEDYASGKLSTEQFLQNVKSDHASDIMESMWGNLGKSFYINAANRGAVTNLPEDAFLELRSDIDMRGPRPQPFGAFPRGLLALQHQILDTYELTAEAAVTGDRSILRRAVLTDPICNNIADSDGCIADMLEAEREALPAYWYQPVAR